MTARPSDLEGVRERLGAAKVLAEIAQDEAVSSKDFDAICDAFPALCVDVGLLLAENAAMREALEEAAIALEVLHGEIPYFRLSPWPKKIRALSPELQAQIARAVGAIRAALARLAEKDGQA